jgi:hypothetical protein
MRSKGNPLHVAVDAEFLKMGGALTARSVAFVPFSLSSSHPALLPRPSVLQLETSFVAQYCDLLPAGYSLREHCVEFARGLDEFFPPLERRVGSHQALRHFVRQPAEPLHGDQDITPGQSSKIRSGPACATAQQSVDPYMVPNSRQFHAVGGLGALYRESPASDAFQHLARRLVSKTVLYGPSKAATPAIGVLVKRDSARFQEFLRFRFTSEQEWMDWVETAHEISRKALDASTSSLATVGSGLGSSDQVDVKQCATLAEFSRGLCSHWASYMQPAQGSGGIPTKFYSYGGADVGVLRTAAHLGCSEQKTQSAGREVPSGLQTLRSPMQIVLTDITKSPAFRAMGFELELGLTPRLRHALEKVRGRNPFAEELLSNPDEHNPLWDAAALAALCQVVLRR